jgi:hypothetical protein
LGYEEDELSNEAKDRIIKDVEENWWFCGGRDTHIENDEDEEYGSVVSEAQLTKWEALWKHYFPNRAMPETSHECVCNKGGLRYNCFITNGERMLIIGRVCLKQFLPKQHQEAKDAVAKRCDRCKEIHRNRKDNLCKKCRPIVKMEQRAEEEKRQHEEDEKKKREEEATTLRKRLQEAEEEEEKQAMVCSCGGWKRSQYPECWDCRNKRISSLSEIEKKRMLCACGKTKKPQYPKCFVCSRV